MSKECSHPKQSMWDRTVNVLALSSPLPILEVLHAFQTWWQKQLHRVFAHRDQQGAKPYLFRKSCFDIISFVRMHKTFYFSSRPT